MEEGPSTKPDEEGIPQLVQVRKPGTKSSYFGESSRSMLVRGSQHLAAIRSPDTQETNAFVKHASECHGGTTPNYKMSVVGVFPKCIERQVWGGVLIRRGEEDLDILMNSKLDHFAPAVRKVVFSDTLD